MLTLGVCAIFLSGSLIFIPPAGATGARPAGTLAGNYGRKVAAPDILRAKARPVANTVRRSLSPSVPGACSDGWTSVQSCNVEGANTQLFGSYAVSPNNVWAVGASGSYPDRRTFVQHWDGTTWSVVPSPNGSAADNVLSSVSASNSNDAWAVGYSCDPANCNTSYHTLALHWNGSAWSVVPTPNVGTFGTFLNGVVAFSPNSAWAVGSYSTDTASLTLAMRWNGSAWSTVTTVDNSATDNALYSVAGSNQNGVWAVGYTSGANGTVVLTERWNGSAWSAVDATAPGANSSLTSVSAAGPNDVWAVGTTCVDGCSTYPTLVMHWNGSAWSTMGSPNADSSYNFLNAVVTASSNDVWVGGNYLDSSFSGHNLLLHWNGSNWTRSTPVDPGTMDNSIRSLTARTAQDVWAVGDVSSGAARQTQAQHYDGSPCPSLPGTPTRRGGHR